MIETGDKLEDNRVYADLTFLINLIMDFLILWAAGKMSGVKVVYARLAVGAAVGGIYAVGNLFHVLAFFYTLPFKILFSIVLVVFVLRPRGWQEFKKAYLYFYGISFAAAGSTIAAYYLLPGVGAELSYVWLPAGMLSILAIGYYGTRYMERAIMPDLLQFTVKVRFGEDICSGQGFLDTGNSLRDPVTNRPVIVAEYQFLKKLLPCDLKQVIDGINNESEGLETLALTSWANRLRLIPFTSIGKKNGLLIGVRTDEIIVSAGKKKIQHSNMVIGIYQDTLSRDGKYQMLIPSEILEKG